MHLCLRDNHNGRLLPENATHRLFAQAVSDYFENMENAHSWKKAAISTAHEFSRKASAERLIRMYRTLLQKESQGKFANKEVLDTWDKLLISLKTEWTLLSEKADVIRRAVRKEYKKDRQGNDPAQ
jgi:1,2-diacylglycerol 3-alpha-glucosyltransferase